MPPNRGKKSVTSPLVPREATVPAIPITMHYSDHQLSRALYCFRMDHSHMGHRYLPATMFPKICFRRLGSGTSVLKSTIIWSISPRFRILASWSFSWAYLKCELMRETICLTYQSKDSVRQKPVHGWVFTHKMATPRTRMHLGEPGRRWSTHRRS